MTQRKKLLCSEIRRHLGEQMGLLGLPEEQVIPEKNRRTQV
jgi:hypothetical protein